MPTWRPWRASWGLIVVIGTSFGLLVIAAIGLKVAAYRLRNQVLDRIRVRVLAQKIVEGPHDEAELRRLLGYENAIAGMKSGIYGGPIGDPLVQAILIPFGGIGTINLVENVFQRL